VAAALNRVGLGTLLDLLTVDEELSRAYGPWLTCSAKKARTRCQESAAAAGGDPDAEVFAAAVADTLNELGVRPRPGDGDC
jgi:hypothetical protein